MHQWAGDLPFLGGVKPGCAVSSHLPMSSTSDSRVAFDDAVRLTNATVPDSHAVRILDTFPGVFSTDEPFAGAIRWTESRRRAVNP